MHFLACVHFNSHLCVAHFAQSLGMVRLFRVLTLPCLPLISTPVEVAVVAQELGFDLPVVVRTLGEFLDGGHDLLKECIIFLLQFNFELPILIIEAGEVLDLLEANSVCLEQGLLRRCL